MIVLIKTVLLKEKYKLYKVFSCTLTEYNDLQTNFRKFTEKQPQRRPFLVEFLKRVTKLGEKSLLLWEF